VKAEQLLEGGARSKKKVFSILQGEKLPKKKRRQEMKKRSWGDNFNGEMANNTLGKKKGDLKSHQLKKKSEGRKNRQNGTMEEPNDKASKKKEVQDTNS